MDRNYKKESNRNYVATKFNNWNKNFLEDSRAAEEISELQNRENEITQSEEQEGRTKKNEDNQMPKGHYQTHQYTHDGSPTKRRGKEGEGTKELKSQSSVFTDSVFANSPAH